MTLPNLSSTIHICKLTIGMRTSWFIKRLLTCMLFIENFSFGVDDRLIYQNESIDINSPTSLLILWSSLIKIAIDKSDTVPTTELEAIVRMVYNVHELDLGILNDILLLKILNNHDNLGTRINQL
ncbi:unnamed protein product, partial [Rotaria sp. Silwood2]